MGEPSIGISVAPELPPSRIRQFARRAEDHGFDELWLAEDCFFAGGIAAAAAALAATGRIRVGLGILPAVARNAAFIAMELAALAEMYPGRLVAGLGHGMADWMRQIGAAPRSPLTALEEYLSAVHGLLAGHTVTQQGDYVNLEDVRLDHPPAVVPHLLAGVRGPRSLALAGSRADGVVLAWPATPAYVRHARVLVENGWTSAGRPGAPHIVAGSPISIDADPARARARLRPAVAAELTGPSASAHLEPLGLVEPVADLLASSGSPEEFAERIPDEWIGQLTITGDPEHCAARIQQLHEAGADTLTLSVTADDHDIQHDLIARQMIPLLAILGR